MWVGEGQLTRAHQEHTGRHEAMSQTVQIELDLPGDLERFRLPAALNDRLQELLDRQDQGQPLTAAEFAQAEGLVELAELLTYLRLRAERASRP
jgi:hypothetical protein